MGGFFNMDNKFFRFMGRVADLMILNIVFVLCCIPIVTIGPAITAMYYVTLKMVRNEESYIVKGFFHSFKQNLRQGIVINLILLAVAGLLYLDLGVINNNDMGIVGKIMYVLIWMAMVLYAFVFVYIYALLSRFFNTIKNTFTNALLIAIRHLPMTILLIALTVCPVLIFFIPHAAAAGLILLLYILMGFACVAYVKSIFLVKILDNYMPEEAKAEESDEFAELEVLGHHDEPSQDEAVSDNTDITETPEE